MAKKSGEVLARLNKEIEELNNKIGKLEKFIDSDKFEKFVESPKERKLMKSQLSVMREYGTILEIRRTL